MGLDDVADNFDVDPEVLVDQDVPEATDLRPGNVRVRSGDLLREVVDGFADNLQIAFDRVLRHLRQITIANQQGDVSVAPLNGLKYVIDALGSTAPHSANASTSAEAEIGRLSS